MLFLIYAVEKCNECLDTKGHTILQYLSGLKYITVPCHHCKKPSRTNMVSQILPNIRQTNNEYKKTLSALSTPLILIRVIIIVSQQRRILSPSPQILFQPTFRFWINISYPISVTFQTIKRDIKLTASAKYTQSNRQKHKCVCCCEDD